jgi:gliding motility-associated-like protein
LNYRFLLFALLFISLGEVRAQTGSLQFSLLERVVEPGAIGEFPIYVTNFEELVSIQFSINFDPAVAEFVGSSDGDLPFVAVGGNQADVGKLRLSWFSEGEGISLPDNSRITVLRFRAIGEIGEESLLRITGDPLNIEIFKTTSIPGIFDPVIPERNDGLLRIRADLGLSIDKTDVTCFGESSGSISLSLAVDPGDYQFNWTGPNGFSGQGVSLSNLDTGTYQLEILDSGGLSVLTTSVPISGPSDSLVLETLRRRVARCSGVDGQVEARAVGGTPPYEYTLGSTTNESGDFDNLAPGPYVLQITDANGCLITDSLQVESIPIPMPDLGPAEQSVCEEDTLTLQVALSPGSQASWSTGATGDTIQVVEPGIYSVSVRNTFGCIRSDTVLVRSGVELSIQLESDELEVCPGGSLQLVVSGGDTYAWDAPPGTLDDPSSETPIFSGDSSTLLTVVAKSDCAIDSLLIPIYVYEITANAGPDTCIGPGDDLELFAQGGLFYEWLDNPFPVSDPTIPNPTVTPENSTTYRVRISDVNGCVTEDAVQVLLAEDPLTAIVPINLITPNGDGKNDILTFANIEKYGFNSLKIYNRWGELVYQRINYMQDADRFDGTHDGRPLPAGNYFYTLRFRTGILKQTLVILR